MNIDALKDSASAAIDQLGDIAPSSALILGSGWSDVAESFEIAASIDYQSIPLMSSSSVKGHAGRLLHSKCPEKEMLIFQGRHHWYEGTGWDSVAFPVFLSNELGVKSIILTNAAGSLYSSLNPGELMIIDDHINQMSSNPLVGAHDPYWGPRFPDQTEVYSKKLRSIISEACIKTSAPYHHGIYASKDGPIYETPAEVTALRNAGASAVGMSTVPEAILANSLGIQTAAVSCITNYASGISDQPLSHEEVLSATAAAMPVMKEVLRESFLAI